MLRFNHLPHRFGRWLVLVTVLLATLAPTLSQALALARGEVIVWSTLCRNSAVSPQAAKLSLAEQSRPEPRELAKHGLFEHCPFCALQTQDLAPPPSSPMLTLPPSGLSFEMPERFYSAPSSAHAWAPAQSRAPPLNH